jgi:hypothetical protein
MFRTGSACMEPRSTSHPIYGSDFSFLLLFSSFRPQTSMESLLHVFSLYFRIPSFEYFIYFRFYYILHIVFVVAGPSLSFIFFFPNRLVLLFFPFRSSSSCSGVFLNLSIGCQRWRSKPTTLFAWFLSTGSLFGSHLASLLRLCDVLKFYSCSALVQFALPLIVSIPFIDAKFVGLNKSRRPKLLA